MADTFLKTGAMIGETTQLHLYKDLRLHGIAPKPQVNIEIEEKKKIRTGVRYLCAVSDIVTC